MSIFAVAELQHSSSHEIYQHVYDMIIRNFKYLAPVIH